MRYLCPTLLLTTLLAGCGPPKELIREMHAHFNNRQWAGVTEKYADLGKPDDFSSVTYARVAYAAGHVYRQSKSPAYLNLAQDTYDRAALIDSSLADEYAYQKARLLDAADQTDAALDAYQRALAMNPRHVKAARHAIRSLLSRKQYQQAIAAGSGLLNLRQPLNTDLREALMDLARAYQRAGQSQQSLDVYRHILAIAPPDWEIEVQYDLARYYDEQGENGLARTTMRKALAGMSASDPRYERFRRYLDQLERKSRQAADTPVTPPDRVAGPAVTVPETQDPSTTTTQDPEDTDESPRRRAEALAARAQVLADEGKDHEAIELLTEAVDLAPDWPAPAAKLASLLYRQGNVDEARGVLEEATRHNPDDEILKRMLEQF